MKLVYHLFFLISGGNLYIDYKIYGDGNNRAQLYYHILTILLDSTVIMSFSK